MSPVGVGNLTISPWNLPLACESLILDTALILYVDYGYVC